MACLVLAFRDFRGVHGYFGEKRGRRRRRQPGDGVRTSVVVVFTWLLALTTGTAAPLQRFTSQTWLFLGLSGVATGLSWLCYFHALQVGEASRVAPIDKLSVVFVILLATVFLGEKLTWGKGVGVVLIAAGAIAIALD